LSDDILEDMTNRYHRLTFISLLTVIAQIFF